MKKWMVNLFVGSWLINSLFAQVGGKTMVNSADGDLQYQTEFSSGKVTILRPTELEMQAIRKRADDGDPEAQMLISQVQYALKNIGEGENWLKRAAIKGNIFAECSLGLELVFGVHGGPKRPDEGIPWLKLAANEGHPGAERSLADCYRRGIGVNKDDFEGYTWLLISLRSSPWQDDAGTKMLPPFEKALSNAEIQRARLRAKNFLPTVTDKNALVDTGMIKIKAISQSQAKPIALINGQAFTTGEQKKVDWLGRAIEVRCLEINSNTAVIATEPYWQRAELRSAK